MHTYVQVEAISVVLQVLGKFSKFCLATFPGSQLDTQVWEGTHTHTYFVNNNIAQHVLILTGLLFILSGDLLYA